MPKYIYKVTNLINGKIYIGKKSLKFTPSYLGGGVLIKRAVTKYGRENFKLEVIHNALETESIDDLEKFYIKMYRDLVGKSRMYNITDGGGGGVGRPSPKRGKTWEEYYGIYRARKIKEKLSISKSNSISNRKNKTYEEFYGESRARAIKDKIRCTNTGRSQSKSSCRKKSIALKGRKQSSSHIFKRANARRNNSGSLKGKTYEDIYGIKRAAHYKMLRQKSRNGAKKCPSSR